MDAFPFDGSSRIVVVIAGADAAPMLRAQRAELLKHVAGLDERDMVVSAVRPDHAIEPIHGRAPTKADVEDFMRRDPSLAIQDAGSFAVLLVGKDGGVKFDAARPVGAPELFALVDAMPMRRQEMQRR